MEENAVSDYTLRYVGDQALLVEFENEISMEVNQKVRALKYDLEQKKIPGMGELVPTYRALLIHYDSLRADLDQLKETIQASAASLDLSHLPRATVTEIPVLYEGEYALDLEEIA
ncbi:MAG: allophanate hydrolase subunit 1, partial [Lawsonibacter sp.]|nr:allophanate hydrolase subunit 1 [Lawsonibacter sp.]